MQRFRPSPLAVGCQCSSKLSALTVVLPVTSWPARANSHTHQHNRCASTLWTLRWTVSRTRATAKRVAASASATTRPTLLCSAACAAAQAAWHPSTPGAPRLPFPPSPAVQAPNREAQPTHPPLQPPAQMHYQVAEVAARAALGVRDLQRPRGLAGGQPGESGGSGARAGRRGPVGRRRAPGMAGLSAPAAAAAHRAVARRAAALCQAPAAAGLSPRGAPGTAPAAARRPAARVPRLRALPMKEAALLLLLVPRCTLNTWVQARRQTHVTVKAAYIHVLSLHTRTLAMLPAPCPRGQPQGHATPARPAPQRAAHRPSGLRSLMSFITSSASSLPSAPGPHARSRELESGWYMRTARR